MRSCKSDRTGSLYDRILLPGGVTWTRSLPLCLTWVWSDSNQANPEEKRLPLMCLYGYREILYTRITDQTESLFTVKAGCDQRGKARGRRSGICIMTSRHSLSLDPIDEPAWGPHRPGRRQIIEPPPYPAGLRQLRLGDCGGWGEVISCSSLAHFYFFNAFIFGI